MTMMMAAHEMVAAGCTLTSLSAASKGLQLTAYSQTSLAVTAINAFLVQEGATRIHSIASMVATRLGAVRTMVMEIGVVRRCRSFKFLIVYFFPWRYLLRNSSVQLSAVWYRRRGLFEPRVMQRRQIRSDAYSFIKSRNDRRFFILGLDN